MKLEDKLDVLLADVQTLKERVSPTIQLATIPEAAKIVRLSERQIRRGIKQGRFKPYREGDRTNVNPKQILDQMEAEGAAHG